MGTFKWIIGAPSYLNCSRYQSDLTVSFSTVCSLAWLHMNAPRHTIKNESLTHINKNRMGLIDRRVIWRRCMFWFSSCIHAWFDRWQKYRMRESIETWKFHSQCIWKIRKMVEREGKIHQIVIDFGCCDYFASQQFMGSGNNMFRIMSSNVNAGVSGNRQAIQFSACCLNNALRRPEIGRF